jgi:hypothetical protein
MQRSLFVVEDIQALLHPFTKSYIFNFHAGIKEWKRKK